MASYFIAALWDKWETSPVYVSIETTSYPVPNIPFPAVSICSVNKVQEHRLENTLYGIKKDKKGAYDAYDKDDVADMLEALIRYDFINESDPFFSDPPDVPASDLLKMFKSVS